MLRLRVLGGALFEKRNRQRRNGKLADLLDFQQILPLPLAQLRIQHFGVGCEVVAHQEGAEAVEDLREDDALVSRRGDRQGQPQLIGHPHAAPVGGQGDNHVALGDVLLKRFLNRSARFLCSRLYCHQDGKARQEHQPSEPPAAINSPKRPAKMSHHPFPVGIP